MTVTTPTLTPYICIASAEIAECKYAKTVQVIGFGVIFTLRDTDSNTDSDSDSKPDGYIVLNRNCSHCTDSDSDSDLEPNHLLYPFFGQIFVLGSGSKSLSSRAGIAQSVERLPDLTL